ncbi:helix-turn-helix domain-containing protein [Tabrizicola sp.]|uniref:TetR/AcrR family transcriptional regulator n=1 Tax=Tabrizicola sp. TaxID=2005166 RepID=UPI00286D0579|nr:helix-turn-helix domain-containing protein [Tabrizicola sp.]
MQETMRRSQKERSDAMRGALMQAGRKLFVTRGFSGTGTPDIVAAAGVTRGALYHHFADKEALFEAVIRAEAEAVALAVEAADYTSLAPVDALIRGGEAFLTAMQVPGRARLLLTEAPAALGLAKLAVIDRETGARTLVEGLAAAGLHDAALAGLLSAAHDRAALAIAQGEAEEPWRAALQRLVRGAVG